MRRGGIAVSKEFLNSGTNFLNDVENNISPRTAFNNRTTETITNLKWKAMYGEGFKFGVKAKKRHLSKGRRPVKTKRSKVVKRKKTVTKRKSLKNKRKSLKNKDI